MHVKIVLDLMTAAISTRRGLEQKCFNLNDLLWKLTHLRICSQRCFEEGQCIGGTLLNHTAKLNPGVRRTSCKITQFLKLTTFCHSGLHQWLPQATEMPVLHPLQGKREAVLGRSLEKSPKRHVWLQPLVAVADQQDLHAVRLLPEGGQRLHRLHLGRLHVLPQGTVRGSHGEPANTQLHNLCIFYIHWMHLSTTKRLYAPKELPEYRKDTATSFRLYRSY